VVGALEVVGADVVGSSLCGVLVLRGAVVLGSAVVLRGVLLVVRGSLVVVRGAPLVSVGVLVAVDVGAGAWLAVVGGVVVGAVVVGRASLGSAEFGTATVRPLGRTTDVVPASGCGSPEFSA
jgi:hypothetical protein